MKKYSFWSNLLYEYGILWRKKKDALFASVAETLLAVLLPLFSAWVTAYVVQLVIDKTPPVTLFVTIFGAFTVYGLAASFAAYFRERCALQFIEVRLSNYMTALYRKMMELRLDVIEEPGMRVKVEKSMMALGGNRWGIEGFYHSTSAFAIKVFGLVTYITIIGSLKPSILVLLIVTAIISGFASYGVNLYKEKKRDAEAKETMTMRYIDRLTDNAVCGKDIRVFGLTDWIIGKYDTAIKNVRKINFLGETLSFGRDTVDNVFSFLRNIVCYLYLINLLRQGMPIAEFVFFIGLIGGFATWLEYIARFFTDMLRDSHMISDYRSFFNETGVIESSEKTKLPKGEGLNIVFDHVSFKYPGSDEVVLKDVSFSLKQGEKLALVGVNGAGKSTIVKLVSGLYMPTGGRVLVNGIDTREIDLYDYYAKESVVFQDAFLTGYSIAENIALCDKYDETKVNAVLTKAGLYDKVQSLHKGILTCIGTDIEDDGVQLSGGETQKLLLARALYNNPKLIILDEPTAALDAIAESEVYHSYKENLVGVSSIFISHRLASTRFCDKILFLENGVISEEGSHDELIRSGGKYTKMFEVQSKYYKEGGDDGTEYCQ